jgi:hypothetical protein
VSARLGPAQNGISKGITLVIGGSGGKAQQKFDCCGQHR